MESWWSQESYFDVWLQTVIKPRCAFILGTFQCFKKKEKSKLKVVPTSWRYTLSWHRRLRLQGSLINQIRSRRWASKERELGIPLQDGQQRRQSHSVLASSLPTLRVRSRKKLRNRRWELICRKSYRRCCWLPSGEKVSRTGNSVTSEGALLIDP